MITALTEQQLKNKNNMNNSQYNLDYMNTAMSGFQINKQTGQTFIPYRESKLTCLLKQSLGGNSYTLMIACLSPSDRYIDENLSTLNYAARASLISNVPTKNIDPKVLLINEQRKKISDLEKELRNANHHIQFLTQLNEDKQKYIDDLETKLGSQGNTKIQLKNLTNSNIIIQNNSILSQ